MTPIIRNLAILLAQDIRHHQGRYTRFNRRQALTLIEDAIKAPDATDKDLVNAIMAAQNHILSDPSFFNFGIRGQAGSYFLKATNDFLSQVKRLKEDLSAIAKPIQPLAELIAKDIDDKTANRSPTLLAFTKAAKDKNSSDQAVFNAAVEHYNYVHKHRFAFWRHDWGIFRKISNFLRQATTLHKLSQSQEHEKPKPEPEEVKKPEPELSERQQAVIEFKAKNKKYVDMEKDRDGLGDQIYARFKKLYQTDLSTATWHYLIQQVSSGAKPVDDVFFFDLKLHKDKIDQDPILSDLASKYKKIIQDQDFLNFLRDLKFKQENSPKPSKKPNQDEPQNVRARPMLALLTEEEKEARLEKLREKARKNYKKKKSSEPQDKDIQLKLKEFEEKNPGFVTLEIKRRIIETLILYFLYRDRELCQSHAMQAWTRRTNQIAERLTRADNMIYFENYKKELQPIKKLVDIYKNNFTSGEYKDYLNRIFDILNAPPPPKPSVDDSEDDIEEDNNDNNKTRIQDINKFLLDARQTALQKLSFHRMDKEVALRLATLKIFDETHPEEVDQHKKRIDLERVILEKLGTEHSLTREPTIWRMLLATAGTDFADLLRFFERFEQFDKTGKANKDVVMPSAELAGYVVEYKKIISDKKYQRFYHKREKLHNASEQEIRLEFEDYLPSSEKREKHEALEEIREDCAKFGLYIPIRGSVR